jgi:hypothetical protein
MADVRREEASPETDSTDSASTPAVNGDGDGGSLDRNGRQVHWFNSQMANPGAARRSDLLLSMLDSQAWREFTDVVGTHRFLPGEFDYFLAQQGLVREHLMQGLHDISAKARLEAAMDKRRTGEHGYRRPVLLGRRQNPRPERASESSGRTAAGAHAPVRGGRTVGPGRQTVGQSVRRDRASVDPPPMATSEQPHWIELRAQAHRLCDEDLARLVEAINFERRRRRRGHPIGQPARGPTPTVDPQLPRRPTVGQRDTPWQLDAAPPQPIPHPRIDADTTQLHAQRR